MADPWDEKEKTPVLPLALIGGGALLLGMAFLAWHAFEQGWIQETERLALGLVASVGLVVAAWPLARRGHISAAGAVGGAGLGAWFMAWLVARHVHDLITAPQAFAALAAGAVACLVVAGRLRLRIMAGLACAAACATPALTATGVDRLPELMTYQLAILGVLAVLDARRGWSELPTLGIVGMWALLVGWAAQHLGPHNQTAFMTSTAILVLATAASAWRLLTRAAAASEQTHVAVRIGLTGVVAWVAAAWTFFEAVPTLAVGTFALAAWHLVLARLTRDTPVGRVALRLGWVQAVAVGPLMFSGVGVSAYLGVLAMVAAGIACVTGSDRARSLTILPTVVAVGWALFAHAQAWALPAAAAAVLVPFAVGLWPARRHGEPPLLYAALGTCLWILAVVVLGPDAPEAKLAFGVAPVVLVGVHAIARPAVTLRLAALHLFTATAVAGSIIIGTGVAAPGMMFALLAGLAALSIGLVSRAAPGPDADLVGIAAAALLGIGLYLAVPLTVPALTAPAHTVILATVGLGLLVAGLRLQRQAWRHVGLAAIGLAGAKIVVFDLAHAPLPARALSFIGIGAVLILGAIAYGNAHRRRRRLLP